MADDDYFGPYEYYEPDEDDLEGLYRVDEYFYDAQQDLIDLFAANPKKVYFLRQLQVKFEDKYYHWITNNAAMGLLKMGKLKEERVPSARGGMTTRFLTQPSNRYIKRETKKAQQLIDEYSNPDVTISCGIRAENLFCVGLVLLRQINEFTHINIFIRYTAIRCRTSGREGMRFSSRCLLRHRSEERTGH